MTSSIGDNSKELTESEEKALFFHHLRKDMSTKGKIKELQAQQKADRKLCQADGFALSRLDFAQKALGADDKSTITQKVEDQLKIMEWLNIIPAYNNDLFADRAPKEEKIEGQGQIAGLAGVDRVSGYAAGSEEDKTWLRGYDQGVSIMDHLKSARAKKDSIRSKEAPPSDSDDPFGAVDF